MPSLVRRPIRTNHSRLPAWNLTVCRPRLESVHLNFEGKTTANPAPADITRAVPRERVPEEWTIELVGDDGISIEADPGPENGSFRVACVEGRRIYDATGLLDAGQLEQLLIAFLKRDGSWRKLTSWKVWVPEPPAPERHAAWLPALAILIAALAALAAAMWYFGLL